MKRKTVLILIMSVLVFTLAACGSSEEEHVITGSDGGTEEETSYTVAAQDGDESSVSEDEEEDTVSESESTGGYHFICMGAVIAMDQDMEEVLETIGEPESYYEAISCAFEGMDKIYTYESFEIETYPQDDKDLISSLVFKDDAVSTSEGIRIGSSLEEVLDVYGDDYTSDSGMMVYHKDNMKLCFIVRDDTVASIQYFSDVLDE